MENHSLKGVELMPDEWLGQLPLSPHWHFQIRATRAAVA